MGEVEIGLQVMSDEFMVSKFLAIIGCDCVDRSIQRVQQMEASQLDGQGSASADFAEQG